MIVYALPNALIRARTCAWPDGEIALVLKQKPCHYVHRSVDIARLIFLSWDGAS
jgi:hypothetical protein